MFVSVEEVRRFCNIPFTDDDLTLAELIESAESTVEKYMGQPLSVFIADNQELDPALKLCIKSLVATWYGNREAIAYGQPHKLPLSFEFVLQPFKKYVKE